MIRAGKPQSIKLHNTHLIRTLIVQNGPVTKPELASITHLSLPTVNRIVDELVESSFAKETQIQDAQRAGRPAKVYIANKNYSAYVGVYFQDGNWTAFRSNFLGEVEAREVFRAMGPDNRLDVPIIGKGLDAGRKPDQLEYLCRAVRTMTEGKKNIRVIALGIPGVVQHDGIITGIPQLSELENINLEKELRARFHLPVIIENDVKLKTLGYHSEYLQELSSIVFLYIGSGIGAGIILDGQLYKGMSNFAGEFGFMPDGKQEMEKTLLSLRKTLKVDPENASAREKLEKKLAGMLVNVVTVLNPQAVVIDSRVLGEDSLERIAKLIGRSVPAACAPALYKAEGRFFEEEGLIQLCGAYYANHTEEWLAL